jgi:hypothetical protein
MVLPQSPFAPAAAYRIEYTDPERFVREMYALFDLTPPTDVESTDATADMFAIGTATEPGDRADNAGVDRD